jgi:predicted permease
MIWRRKRMLEKLDLDFEEHIRRETEDNIHRGLNPEEARYAALRKFGNVTRIKEDTREIWSFTWLEQLARDVRYALRTLRRNPGFAAAAILSLGLGIGVNTAVFSVVNTVLLQRLPYPDADRIVAFSNGVSAGEHFKEDLPGATFAEWRAHAQSFDQLAGYWHRDATLSSAKSAELMRVVSVTGDFWALTGARAARGRLFDSNAQSPSIVLSHAVFERQFNGDTGIIGKTVNLDGEPVTVVGVLPANYRFLFRDFLSNVTPSDAASAVGAFTPGPVLVRGVPSHWFVVGHLKPLVSVERALAELQGIQASILKAYPDRWFPGIARMQLLPLRSELTRDSRQALWILQIAGFFVLLIACTNIANLLLARGAARSREIAIRASVGAGVGRVLRQFLAEGLLLSLSGGTAGLIIAWSAIAMMKHFGTGAVPRLSESAIDARVLVFTLSLCLLSGIAFGLAPGVTLWRSGVQDALRSGTRQVSSGDVRLRGFLVTAELALAIVLLSGAGLMVKSFWKMYADPPGFSPEHTLVMKVALSGPQYAKPAQQSVYTEELLRRIGALPGVQACGVTNSELLLMQAANPAVPAIVDRFQNSLVSQGYFRAIGMQLLRGRWITDSDPADTVVINETLARRVFGDSDPVGQRMQKLNKLRAVGVAANLKYSKRDAMPGPEVFRPYSKNLWGGNASLTIVVRMPGDPLGISLTARKMISGIDPEQPVYDIQTLEQALTTSIAARRFNLFLLGAFAISALLIALVGIYGVMAYAVTQRTREIGIRMALGAQRGTVVRMIVAQGMRITVWGVAVGLGGALAFTRVMASLLYDVAPNDPATFAVTLSILITCVLLACWRPALRAALVDPQVALRHE